MEIEELKTSLALFSSISRLLCVESFDFIQNPAHKALLHKTEKRRMACKIKMEQSRATTTFVAEQKEARARSCQAMSSRKIQLATWIKRERERNINVRSRRSDRVISESSLGQLCVVGWKLFSSPYDIYCWKSRFRFVSYMLLLLFAVLAMSRREKRRHLN